MAAHYRAMSPEDRRERLIQLRIAEATALAIKNGMPPPVFYVPYQPRPLPPPDSEFITPNRHRARRRIERAECAAAAKVAASTDKS
jgi:hypothetical protein